MHARGEGIDALDGLEVNGQVVDEGEEAARDEKDGGIRGPHAANFKDAGLQQSAVTDPKLVCDESDEQQDETDHGNNDGAVGPGFGGATPLERKQVADDGCHDKEYPNEIHL